MNADIITKNYSEPTEATAPLAIKVYDHVLSLIRDRVFLPGQYLPSIRKLADELNVSSNSVFLGLKELQRQNLVEQKSNRRYTVSIANVPKRKLCSIAFCSCGFGRIRQGTYQTIFNCLNDLCGENTKLDCLLEMTDTWSNKPDGYYDAIITADWHPVDFRRLCRNPVIGLDTWRGVDVDVVVKTDHHRGGEIAGQFLRQCGYDKVVYWDYFTQKSSLLEGMAMRQLGFSKGWLEEGGYLNDIVYLPCYDDDVDLSAEIVRRAGECDAFFASNDRIALYLWRILDKHGIKVPDDIGMMGFDGTYNAIVHNPPLATIRQPWEEIAGKVLELADAFADRSAPPEERQLLIPPILIPGKSTRNKSNREE